MASLGHNGRWYKMNIGIIVIQLIGNGNLAKDTLNIYKLSMCHFTVSFIRNQMIDIVLNRPFF